MDLSSVQAWAVWFLAFAGSFLGAYATAMAKRLSDRRYSAEMRDELARNTQAVKEIEAKISGEVWHRQMHWNQKRDLYAGVLRLLLNIRDRYLFLLNRNIGPDKFGEVLRELRAEETEYMLYLSLAVIFGNEDCTTAMKEERLDIPDSIPPSEEWISAKVHQLTELMVRLIAAAKKDLAVPQ